MGERIIRVALDWTPNTIHSGLFVSLSKSFYKDNGLKVELIEPNEEYVTTPGKLLLSDKVDLIVCPSESIIAYNETSKMKLQGIYTILKKDASCIGSLNCSNIKDFNSKTYGSYVAKYEDDIVKNMISNGGGDGNTLKIEKSTGKLSLFNEMLSSKIDSTWIFLPWEGIEAKLNGIELHKYQMRDYGIPYGYSPIIARKIDGNLDDDTVGKFVKSTIKGYQYAIDNPNDAVEILKNYCKPARSNEFLKASQEMINEYYVKDDFDDSDDKNQFLGYMNPKKWDKWLTWLKSKELLKVELSKEDLFTNEFIIN